MLSTSYYNCSLHADPNNVCWVEGCQLFYQNCGREKQWGGGMGCLCLRGILTIFIHNCDQMTIFHNFYLKRCKRGAWWTYVYSIIFSLVNNYGYISRFWKEARYICMDGRGSALGLVESGGSWKGQVWGGRAASPALKDPLYINVSQFCLLTLIFSILLATQVL